MPRISVLMPVYNTRPEHLREAMESILAQTFTDFEFLILNDASTDPEVEAVVKSYDDPRIVYSVNEHNLGISGSRNRLIDMAQGEYLAVMDHDDISLPERFAKQVEFLDQHPEVGVVGTLVKNMEKGKVDPRPASDREIKKMLMIHCNLSHPSCMMRHSVLKENNIRYESIYSPSEDYALFARLIACTQFAILQEVLFYYRAWKGNTSHIQASKMESAARGIHSFLRRDNPELWAMARTHLVERRQYRLLGIPFLLKETTWREHKWLLFGVLPILRIKDLMPHIKNI